MRDMFAVFADRMVLAVAEDDPVVPWFDPGEEGWVEYNRLPAEQVAAEICDRAAHFADVVATTSPGQWGRTARRDGTDVFTVAGLACFGAHEGHHHLMDVNGELAAALGRQSDELG